MVGTVSPSGPKLASRHGLGLLSLAATDPSGHDQLPVHWQIMQEEAARADRTVDRDCWRLIGPMHLAESAEPGNQHALRPERHQRRCGAAAGTYVGQRPD